MNTLAKKIAIRAIGCLLLLSSCDKKQDQDPILPPCNAIVNFNGNAIKYNADQTINFYISNYNESGKYVYFGSGGIDKLTLDEKRFPIASGNTINDFGYSYTYSMDHKLLLTKVHYLPVGHAVTERHKDSVEYFLGNISRIFKSEWHSNNPWGDPAFYPTDTLNLHYSNENAPQQHALIAHMWLFYGGALDISLLPLLSKNKLISVNTSSGKSYQYSYEHNSNSTTEIYITTTDSGQVYKRNTAVYQCPF